MRAVAALAPLLVLAACATPIPDSGATASGKEPLGAMGTDSEGALVAAEVTDALGLNGSTEGTAPVGEPLNAMAADSAVNAADAPTATRPAGISDEQNFQAVSGRESIESDAQRLAENRARYVVIEPTELPQRDGGNGASIVKFALATNNAVGQQLYPRSNFNADARFQRNCAKFTSSDLAQEDFLNAGGPKRDPKGLDPDGDGFACYWDPAPFRAARQGAPEVITQYEVVETPGDSGN